LPNTDALALPDIDTLASPDVDMLASPNVDMLASPDIDALALPNVNISFSLGVKILAFAYPSCPGRLIATIALQENQASRCTLLSS
jgi:hypothetical protein